jgi:hypothetical protein
MDIISSVSEGINTRNIYNHNLEHTLLASEVFQLSFGSVGLALVSACDDYLLHVMLPRTKIWKCQKVGKAPGANKSRANSCRSSWL